MKIDIVGKIEENDDGSATMTVELDNEAMTKFIQKGILTCLTESVEKDLVKLRKPWYKRLFNWIFAKPE